MGSWSWRSETEGRLRKAEVSLEAARALIDRKPPCIDDAVNRASAAALQAARALVDARWPPRETELPPHDPTWRPGMSRPEIVGPYSKASWPEIVKQFEKASHEMVLPSDATEYLKALVEDGRIADIGDVTYESDEAVEALETAEKLIRSVSTSLPLAFALGYREAEGGRNGHDEGHHDENATTLEMMPLGGSTQAASTEPHLAKLPFDPPAPAAKADTATDPSQPKSAPAAAGAAEQPREEPSAAGAPGGTPTETRTDLAMVRTEMYRVPVPAEAAEAAPPASAEAAGASVEAKTEPPPPAGQPPGEPAAAEAASSSSAEPASTDPTRAVEPPPGGATPG